MDGEHEPAEASLLLGDGHDGYGWYYWDTEYPEEGSTGMFSTQTEAMEHGTEAGYVFLTPPEET